MAIANERTAVGFREPHVSARAIHPVAMNPAASDCAGDFVFCVFCAHCVLILVLILKGLRFLNPWLFGLVIACSGGYPSFDTRSTSA
jgi:hypothetical protein